jgi:hypothetical protein
MIFNYLSGIFWETKAFRNLEIAFVHCKNSKRCSYRPVGGVIATYWSVVFSRISQGGKFSYRSLNSYLSETG